MPRPTRLEILEYALTGVTTDRGTACPSTEDDFEWMDELDKHYDWIKAEIERVKQKT